MVELKENQIETFVLHNEHLYYCLSSENKGTISLDSYFEVPFIIVEEENLIPDFKKIIETISSFKDYDITKEIKHVKTPADYGDFVNKLMGTMFKLEKLKIFRLAAQEYATNEYNESLSNMIEFLEQKIALNEKIFKEKIVPIIPKNWPYAMFPESSWTAYDSYREIHQFACGNTKISADSLGTSLEDIKYYYSSENQKREMKIYNALNDEIQKTIPKKGLN